MIMYKSRVQNSPRSAKVSSFGQKGKHYKHFLGLSAGVLKKDVITEKESGIWKKQKTKTRIKTRLKHKNRSSQKTLFASLSFKISNQSFFLFRSPNQHCLDFAASEKTKNNCSNQIYWNDNS